MAIPLDKIAGNSLSGNAPHTADAGRSVLTIEPLDGAEFRAILARMASGGAQQHAAVPPAGGAGLGERIMGRAADLSGEVRKDHEFVSKTLEEATRSGDPMQLMKAMMALSDYQTRVQFIAKATSKAASALDQLTKLQ